MAAYERVTAANERATATNERATTANERATSTFPDGSPPATGNTSLASALLHARGPGAVFTIVDVTAAVASYERLNTRLSFLHWRRSSRPPTQFEQHCITSSTNTVES